jgi:hypothetical protein
MFLIARTAGKMQRKLPLGVVAANGAGLLVRGSTVVL